jgi:hypothetical protein
MRKMGVHEGMIQAMMSTLLNAECVLHVEGVTKAVKMWQGSAQGTSLGPVLCLYFMLPILNLWHGKIQKERTTTFVDTTEGTAEVKTSLNNFADGTMMVVGSETEARKLVRAFTEYIENSRANTRKIF